MACLRKEDQGGWVWSLLMMIKDRQGAAKSLCDKYFAELLDGLSGALCLKILVALSLFRKLFGAVRALFSQNSFVLVFMGYRTGIARYVANWGVAEMCLCEAKYQGGVSYHFGGVLTSLKKYRAIWGIAAIVSQYRAIWAGQS